MQHIKFCYKLNKSSVKHNLYFVLVVMFFELNQSIIGTLQT
jgi:hypothetical protein